MDPDHPAAHDLGIWRGRIAGLDEAVTSLPASEVIDPQGATVLPGFIDAHVHLAWTGCKQNTPSIAGCTRIDDVLAIVEEAVTGKGSPGAGVSIAGYDRRALGRHLTAAELDEVSHGHRLFVIHDSGHGCVVNSAVLDLLPADLPHDNGFLAGAPWAPPAHCASRTPRRSWPRRSDESSAPAWPRVSPPALRQASAALSSATAPSSWALLPETVSVLRVCDVVLWMHHRTDHQQGSCIGT